MEMERGLIKTSGGYVHYWATGQGKPIILLHPCAKSSTMFLELMEVLGKKMRVFAMDTPSYGFSDHLSYQPTIADYAKFVTEFMDGLGLEKANFLGEATGCYTAIELGSAFPEKVETLILASCPWYPTREYAKMRHDRLRKLHKKDATGFPMTRTLDEILEKYPEHRPTNVTQEWLDRDNVSHILAGRDIYQGLNAIAEYDLRPNLERIQCPTLLIWGENFWGLESRDEFTRRIKNYQEVTIPVGVFLLSAGHPEEVGGAVLNFLA